MEKFPKQICHIASRGEVYYMKKWAIRAVLLLLYCIPFAFLSVNGDAQSRTMLFYVLMAIGFAGLCIMSLKTNNIPIIYVGNILSFASSFMVGKLSGLEPMGYYFKPFTSYILIVVISILATILQSVLVLSVKRKQKRK